MATAAPPRCGSSDDPSARLVLHGKLVPCDRLADHGGSVHRALVRGDVDGRPIDVWVTWGQSVTEAISRTGGAT